MGASAWMAMTATSVPTRTDPRCPTTDLAVRRPMARVLRHAGSRRPLAKGYGGPRGTARDATAPTRVEASRHQWATERGVAGHRPRQPAGGAPTRSAERCAPEERQD